MGSTSQHGGVVVEAWWKFCSASLSGVEEEKRERERAA
jgi:hypothetical protein